MLAIKFKRIGKKDQASYRVVIAEKRSKLNGKFVEDIGWFNPHTHASQIVGERVRYWIARGAQPTDSVYNLFIKTKILEGVSRPVHKKKKQESVSSKPAKA